MLNIVNKYKEEFESRLGLIDEYLVGAEEPVLSAVKYAIQGAGKRLRPILVFLAADIMGREHNDVIQVALALECIHNYSLVHDDLPCMDNDDMRHGKPSAHVAYGEGIAVLAGDALLNLAFEILLDGADADRTKAALYIAKKSGIGGMIGGQSIDLRSENRDISLEEIIRLNALKTACLFKAALAGGAIALGADGETVRALEEYSENMGLIFQMVDDILDITSTSEELGKNAGSDIENGKRTYLSVAGMEKTLADIAIYEECACAAANRLGARGENLIKLCKFLSERRK